MVTTDLTHLTGFILGDLYTRAHALRALPNSRQAQQVHQVASALEPPWRDGRDSERRDSGGGPEKTCTYALTRHAVGLRYVAQRWHNGYRNRCGPLFSPGAVRHETFPMRPVASRRGLFQGLSRCVAGSQDVGMKRVSAGPLGIARRHVACQPRGRYRAPPACFSPVVSSSWGRIPRRPFRSHPLPFASLQKKWSAHNVQ